MKKINLVLAALFGSLLVLTGCSGTAGQGENQQGNADLVEVVATNSIIADIAENIGGDKIDLYSIVPVGRDPHEYEFLPADVQKTSEADVIFYNGINLETGGNGWFTTLMENAGKVKDQDYFAVSDGVEVIYLEGAEEQGKEDPHAWLNLSNGMIYAENIAQQLSLKDPENADYYEANLDSYLSQLRELDASAKEKFAALPDEQKLLVTSEGCMKYFSAAYGIPAAYIWEINTEEEGTPEQIQSLIEQLRASSVPTLFVESSVDARSMQTVAKDTGIPINGAKLFTDSVAEPGEEGDSYYSMMAWNFEQIATGLAK